MQRMLTQAILKYPVLTNNNFPVKLLRQIPLSQALMELLSIRLSPQAGKLPAISHLRARAQR